MSDDLVSEIYRPDGILPVTKETVSDLVKALTEARAESGRLRRDKSAGFAFWRSIAKRFCNARKAALDRAAAAESELSTLRARVREVVGPFSRLCEMHVDDDTKDSSGIIFPASRAVVQAGHLRAARQLNEDLK